MRVARSPTSRGIWGISNQAIYNWRRQDRIDRGLEPGFSAIQHPELLAARQRIAEPETELKVARQAVQLLKEVTAKRRLLSPCCGEREPTPAPDLQGRSCTSPR
jgi:transposase-like protein